MSSDKQKFEEQAHFDLFKELYGRWCDGKISHEVGQRPDFLIEYSDKAIGIEHTKPFKPKVPGQVVSSQQREGSLRKVVEDAKNIYEKKGCLPLLVKIIFTPKRIKMKTLQLRQLSKSLAKLIEVWNKNNPSSPSDVLRPESKMPEISHILITRVTLCNQAFWTKVGPGWVKKEFVDEIQKAIDDKNKKYEEYLKNCDECWLLIVADMNNPAQCFDISLSEKVGKHTYQSKFKKTFYLEVTAKRLVKLTTTRQ